MFRHIADHQQFSINDQLFHDNELAAVIATESLVGVQKLDAMDRTIRRDVEVQRIVHLDRLDLCRFLVKTEVRDIVTRIVSQLYRAKSI
jgi:hypothetical protein